MMWIMLSLVFVFDLVWLSCAFIDIKLLVALIWYLQLRVNSFAMTNSQSLRISQQQLVRHNDARKAIGNENTHQRCFFKRLSLCKSQ